MFCERSDPLLLKFVPKYSNGLVVLLRGPHCFLTSTRAPAKSFLNSKRDAWMCITENFNSLSLD